MAGFINIMSNDKARFPSLVVNFRKAIYDQLKAANPDGKYIKATSSLRAAAFAAAKEVFDAEPEPVGPMLACNVWNAVMLCNESAFHQTMEREIENGSLTGVQVVGGKKAVAAGYFE